jgi:hypothetical protein
LISSDNFSPTEPSGRQWSESIRAANVHFAAISLVAFWRSSLGRFWTTGW